MSLPQPRPLNDKYLTAYLADVSAASSTFVVSPARGKVVAIYTALHGAITGADSALTAKINGTAITGGAITVAYSGSAAGDVDSCVPTGANVVNAGDAIEIASDGASSTTAGLTVTVVIREG